MKVLWIIVLLQNLKFIATWWCNGKYFFIYIYVFKKYEHFEKISYDLIISVTVSKKDLNLAKVVGCDECQPCANSSTTEMCIYPTTHATGNSQETIHVTSKTTVDNTTGKKKVNNKRLDG